MHSSPKGFGKIRTDCFRTDNVCKKKKKRKEKKMTRVNSTGFKAFDFDFTPPLPVLQSRAPAMSDYIGQLCESVLIIWTTRT